MVGHFSLMVELSFYKFEEFNLYEQLIVEVCKRNDQCLGEIMRKYRGYKYSFSPKAVGSTTVVCNLAPPSPFVTLL